MIASGILCWVLGFMCSGNKGSKFAKGAEIFFCTLGFLFFALGAVVWAWRNLP